MKQYSSSANDLIIRNHQLAEAYTLLTRENGNGRWERKTYNALRQSIELEREQIREALTKIYGE